MSGGQDKLSGIPFVFVVILCVLVFASGLAVGFYKGLDEQIEDDREYFSPDVHWEIVNEHLEYQSNPDKFDSPPRTHFRTSLDALASLHEISHADLVLPTVYPDREIKKKWVECVSNSENILWAEMEDVDWQFKISGDKPAHISVWYRNGAEKEVQEMINVLEKLAMKEKQPNNAE